MFLTVSPPPEISRRSSWSFPKNLEGKHGGDDGEFEISGDGGCRVCADDADEC